MADHFWNYTFKGRFKHYFLITEIILLLLRTSKGYSTASPAALIGPDAQQQNNRCGPLRRNWRNTPSEQNDIFDSCGLKTVELI